LTDLNQILVAEMGKLDRAGDTTPTSASEQARRDPCRPRYNFMFSGMLVSDTMGSFIAKLFRLPSHGR
jgi:hypothetical protein